MRLQRARNLSTFPLTATAQNNTQRKLNGASGFCGAYDSEVGVANVWPGMLEFAMFNTLKSKSLTSERTFSVTEKVFAALKSTMLLAGP